MTPKDITDKDMAPLDMAPRDMNDDAFKALLADYAAPADDDGFSDALMRRLDADIVDLAQYAPRRAPFWRSWGFALITGLLCGWLWVRFGVSLPDIEWRDSALSVLEADWAVYMLCGLGVTGCLMAVESEAI